MATGAADVEAARRLRSEVVAGERGAPLPGSRTMDSLDADGWDEHCDHVLVHDDSTGAVVGTYRLLPPERAAALGRGHGDGGFDLSPHAALRPDLVEVGRACVRPGHRAGAVLPLLWAGITRYVLEGGYRYLGGCVSIPPDGGSATAAGVWEVVRARHLAPAALRVVPQVPVDVWTPAPTARPELPPLLRAYLRIGAHVCGPPALDAESGGADLYLLLRMVDVSPRLLRRLAAHA
jgi:putative hemolysin